MSETKPRYKKILLKMSGEVLMGGGIASLLPGKVRLGEGGYCLVTREGRKML